MSKFTPGHLRESARMWAELGVHDRAAAENAHADALEERQALVEALKEYMSQFGQALDAHGIAYGAAQEVADKYARALLARMGE